MNSFNFNKSSSASVYPGTRTCLIQIGMLLSLKYLAKVSSFSLLNPTKSLHFFESMCLISNNTKSVRDKTSLIVSVISTIPEVSMAV